MTGDFDSQSFDIDDLASLPEPERMVFDDYGPPPSIEVDVPSGLVLDDDPHTSLDALDVADRPSLRMRARMLIQRGDTQTKTPMIGEQRVEGAHNDKVAVDERFARLLRPLAPSELRQLQTDVQKAELFFETVDRVKRINEYIRAISLVIAMAAMAALTFKFGEAYLTGLADAPIPAWLNGPGLTAQYRTMIVYIAGFFLPFAVVFLLAETLSYVARAIWHRLIGSLVPAVVAGAACFGATALMIRMDVVVGLFVAIAGTLVASVLSDLFLPGNRRRRRRGGRS